MKFSIRCWVLALLVVAGSAFSPAHAASRVEGWQQQSARIAFLSSHSRWKIQVSIRVISSAGVETADGRLLVMRGGMAKHEDGAVDVVLFVPTEGKPRWFLHRDGKFEFFEGDVQQSLVDDAQWWSTLGIDSTDQWLSWVAATPTPIADGLRCRFEKTKKRPALLSRCKTSSSRVTWLNWSRATTDQSGGWELWMPGQVLINKANGDRIEIKVLGFEARRHGEGSSSWPVPFLGPSRVMDPEVPLSELDYEQW